MIAERVDSQLKLPGIASAHSHAFQRALRGHCQRQAAAAGSFWSWRGRMYALATALDPESIYDLSRFAYAELAMAGVCAVGEFHYVHHQVDGTPYEDSAAMAKAVIAAAQDVGIRISLLRVLYHRAGANLEATPEQARFCDPSIDAALARVDQLRSACASMEGVKLGLALHSVRAVPASWMSPAASYARRHSMPIHMHLSEQRRELQECTAEHGVPPVLLAEKQGLLGEDFVAVHATHLADEEVQALGASKSFVCACRTTERDLGDGHMRARDLLDAGARLCFGVDSHAISDPFEEARALELDARSRYEGRTLVADASDLLRFSTVDGYTALGLSGCAEDAVMLSAQDPALVGFQDDRLDDAIVYGAGPRSVQGLRVRGRQLLEGGLHRDYEEIRQRYEAALARLSAKAESSQG